MDRWHVPMTLGDMIGLGITIFWVSVLTIGLPIWSMKVKRNKTKLIDLALTRYKPATELRIGLLRLGPSDLRYTGEYLLKWIDDSPFVMNMDRPRQFLERRLTNALRRRVLRRAKRLNAKIVPVSFNALTRARISFKEIQLVDRHGFDCVFSAPPEPPRYDTYAFEDALRGKRPVAKKRPKKYFLSAWDRNEFPPLYFLTELPKPVESLAEALEALKPESVKEAERKGHRVYRQGDMFAFSTDMTTREILEQGGKLEERVTLGRNLVTAKSLYGTAHTASTVATLPDGTHLARGKLYHAPRLIDEARNPDHKPVTLQANRWHLVAKNTTPMK